MRNKQTFDAQTEQWLLTVAWKKMTVTQIAEHLKVQQTAISMFYSQRDIECMTLRDFVTKKIFDLYETGERLEMKEIVKRVGSSSPTVKSIIDQYGLDFKIRNHSRVDFETKLTEYDKRVEEKKQERAKLAVYNQTGNETIDSLRGIRTTKRL